MNRQIFKIWRRAWLVLLCVGLTRAAEPPYEVIASGLDNPRGLTFAHDGALYITEAGRGGDGPCLADPREEGGERCFGLSGAITQVLDGVQTRIVSGLPSLAGAGGYRASGPTDIVLGAGNIAFIVIGLGTPAGTRENRDALGPEAADLGKLLMVNLKQGAWESVADVVAYESAEDPDGAGADSNPYALLSVPGRFIVADAGGNDLLGIKHNGEISTLTVFPNRMADAPPSFGLPQGAQIPMQTVPNTLALGPDLALYIGELTGVPFPVGGARVYRITPGGEPQVFAEGFTNIIDIEFRPDDGLLYVLEHAANGLFSGDTTGALIRVNEDGTKDIIASDGLVSPGGLAFGADGAAYVTNFSEEAEVGEVIRIPIEPLPEGLVARFTFEGNAKNSIGGQNATSYGGPLYESGKFGQAISFDGVDDYVVVGSVGISGSDPRTIAGWAKASSMTLPPWTNVFGFTGPPRTWGHFDIELMGDSDWTNLGWYGVHIEGPQQNIIRVDLEWHHLAFTFDGRSYRWYGDGRSVGSSDGHGGTIVLNTPDNFHIGKRQDNNNYFPGMVDDVQIYSRALSNTEIAKLAGR